MTETKKGCTCFEAVVNLTKLCIGTGILALPFSANKGGLILSPIIIAIIALWNLYNIFLLLKCKEICEEKKFDNRSKISSTYSWIAYASFGWFGVVFIDMCIIITLIGVCITYQIVFADLIHPEMNNVSKSTLIIVSSVIVYPMSCSKGVGVLAKISLYGLICLLISIISIVLFGVKSYGDYTSNNSIPLWPATSLDLFSNVGISSFGFGVCALVLNIEESMDNKKEIKKASLLSLVFVWFIYSIVGDGVAILYLNDPIGIKSKTIYLYLTSLSI
jgi:amino acid permease